MAAGSPHQRPPVHTDRVGLALPRTLRERVDERAAQEERSLSSVVRSALEQYLNPEEKEHTAA